MFFCILFHSVSICRCCDQQLCASFSFSIYIWMELAFLRSLCLYMWWFLALFCWLPETLFRLGTRRELVVASRCPIGEPWVGIETTESMYVVQPSRCLIEEPWVEIETSTSMYIVQLTYLPYFATNCKHCTHLVQMSRIPWLTLLSLLFFPFVFKCQILLAILFYLY